MNNDEIQLYTLKIAFGPLTGTELVIKPGDTTIIATPDEKYNLVQGANEGEATIIHLPTDDGDWELHLSLPQYMSEISTDTKNIVDGDTDDSMQYYAELFNGKQHIQRQPIVFQQLMFPDGLPIMLKPLSEDWLFTSHLLPTVQSDKKETEVELETEDTVPARSRPRLFSTLALILLMGALGISYWGYNTLQEDARQVKTLSGLLQGTTSPLVIYNIDPGKNVILVPTQRDVDWVTQRLVSEQYNQNTRVKLIADEEKTSAAILIAMKIPVLKVDLSNPYIPKVRILGSTTSKTQQQKIIEQIKLQHPYAKDIIVSSYSQQALLQEAIYGVKKSDAPYSIVQSGKKRIVTVKGELNDKQIQAISNFASNFHKKWGEEYVQISVSLNTNYLAGKSFFDTKNGYVLLNNNHWYFTL
ncbi:type III secretion system needle complex protein PrgH [Serratia quinivorans]|uniref:PrgH/EprH family type III secretion apparatus protein n=1 Tax=Serratia quinivorans TaxID=137545 RepID=UPI00217B526F|nr:PrgH/EprH family type III secretion apparatus protein [Serratia quinivorans]CAI1904961.1 type III secretion system needle complex protein PrgH [Serratia quinivorans]